MYSVFGLHWTLRVDYNLCKNNNSYPDQKKEMISYTHFFRLQLTKDIDLKQFGWRRIRWSVCSSLIKFNEHHLIGGAVIVANCWTGRQI